MSWEFWISIIVASSIAYWFLVAYTAIKAIKTVKEGQPEIMRGLDECFTILDTDTNVTVINGLIILDEKLKRDELVELLRNTLDDFRFRRFRQVPRGILSNKHFSLRSYIKIPGMIGPRWIYVHDFDPTTHIHEYHLLDAYITFVGEPEGEMDASTMLRRVVSVLSAKPIDKTKPMWEDYIIHLPNGTSAVLFRIHHGIGDGLSLVKFFNAHTKEIPTDAGSSPPSNADISATPRSKKSAITKLLEIVFLLIQVPLVIFQFFKKAFLNDEKPNVFTGELSQQKYCTWLNFDLNDVKQVARKYSCTVNDISISIVTRAIRKYCEAKGEKAPNMTAFMPVGNVSPMSSKIELANNFGFLFVDFPVSESNPVQCVKKVKKDIDALKQSPAAYVAFYLSALGGYTLAPAVLRAGSNFWASLATVVFSNVMGPQKKVSYCGHPVKEMCFFVPSSGSLALGISIFSYDGKISIAIRADEAIVKEPEELMKLCGPAFDELKNAAAQM